MGTFNWKSKLKNLLRLSGESENSSSASEPRNRAIDEIWHDGEGAESRFRGKRSVRLDRIAGSVGRYQDFDSQFRPRSGKPSGRLREIKRAMAAGHPMPPVKLYQIRDEYYVLDGNHRIAAAKELGHDEILAQIVEFIPSEATLKDLLYRERADFADRTELSAEIDLTEVGQYPQLLDQIRAHRLFLQETRGEDVPLPEASADWYKTIYRPLCDIIRKGELPESFPNRTLGDLYTYISVNHWGKRERRYGIGIGDSIPRTMEDFREKMSDKPSIDYPEMKRWITAFVLMNVQAKREFRIIEKLFELEAVREIHSVHGDVDLLVKIELVRDLLSSDAESISQFVHEQIRQLSGVISTKTLIPGTSKTKEPLTPVPRKKTD